MQPEAANQRIKVLTRDKTISPNLYKPYEYSVTAASELWISVSIFFLTTVVFAVVNARYSGPVILPDEIGYLGYAEFFGGYSVDAASSFHFGYSLALAPLFWFFSSTEDIWRGVTSINGAFFGGALVICFRLSREMFPNRSLTGSALTTALCALYPAWISISGYAFSQGCFVFFFALTAYLLVKSPSSKACAIGASVASSFLFWIHDLGIVCCAISLLMIWLTSRNLRLTLTALALTVLLVGAYMWISPAVKAAMTPDGFAPKEHYPSATDALEILSIPGLLEFSTRSLGQLTYILVATLGLAATPLLIALSASFAMLRGRLDKLQIASLFVVGCIAGMTIFSAAMFTVVESASRQDHWMYGRYNEGALLLVLLIGLSKRPSRISSALALLVPAVFAGSMSILAPQAEPLSVLNSAAFWPSVALPNASFSTQVLVGGLGAGAITAIASSGLAIVALAVAFAVCLPRQFAWHDMASDLQKAPQAVELIRDQIPRGACVGYDADFVRLQLLAFYLFDYRYSRVQPDQWSTPNCDGPFLSMGKGPPNAQWIAIDDWNIRMFGKGAPLQDHYSKITFADGGACADWCYAADADMLLRHSQNGRMLDGALAASGPAGYLIYGPYLSAESGQYHLRLSGAGRGNALLDIATNAGQNIVAKFPLTALSPDGSDFNFDLPSDAKDLEIRLSVPAGSPIAVTGYVLSKDGAAIN